MRWSGRASRAGGGGARGLLPGAGGVQIAPSGRGLGRTARPSTQLEVQVHPPATTHVAKVSDVVRWLEGVAADPATVLNKARLKKMLST